MFYFSYFISIPRRWTWFQRGEHLSFYSPRLFFLLFASGTWTFTLEKIFQQLLNVQPTEVISVKGESRFIVARARIFFCASFIPLCPSWFFIAILLALRGGFIYWNHKHVLHDCKDEHKRQVFSANSVFSSAYKRWPNDFLWSSQLLDLYNFLFTLTVNLIA